MCNILTVLAVENRWEGCNLVDGTIVSHFEDGLELLDNTTLRCVNIILHIGLSEKISFVLKMIENSKLVLTLIAIINCIIKYTTVKPVTIVKENFLILVFIIKLV